MSDRRWRTTATARAATSRRHRLRIGARQIGRGDRCTERELSARREVDVISRQIGTVRGLDYGAVMEIGADALLLRFNRRSLALVAGARYSVRQFDEHDRDVALSDVVPYRL